MQHSLLALLACPRCEGASLGLVVFRQHQLFHREEVQDGVLTCTQCKTFFPISQYIPRFLADQVTRDPEFYRRYAPELQEVRTEFSDFLQDAEPAHWKLQLATIRNFGFEWTVWNKFGWNDAVNIEQTRAIFEYKVLKRPGELAGKMVLDAGCGNGRYTAIAAEYGGTVVGMDLSHAVDSAWDNLGSNERVHLVQGDIFHPPFKKEAFDFIFSNGVLMHTGNAKQAFGSLCRYLKQDGEITIHLYHRGNLVYEMVDAALRWVITRLPLSFAMYISRFLAKIASWIPKGTPQTLVNGFVRLEPHPHYVFDWYTAPIATHHTYPEVYRWLDEQQLHLVHDHNKTDRPLIRKWLPFLFMTVKASKARPMHEPLHTTK